MRARAEGLAVVVWRDHEGRIHEERSTVVNDRYGWLFFTVVGDRAIARLLPMQQVVSVTFPALVIDADPTEVWSRDMEILTEAEVAAGQLQPEDFRS